MTSLPSVAPHVRRGLASFGACVVIMLGVASALAPSSALAELQVGGSPEAVSIDAQNSSIKEILAALGKTFGVHFQSSANLEKQLTGTYQGPLPRVLMRVLEGYNVIMKTRKGGIDITVLGTNAGATAATAATSPALTVASAAPSSPASPVVASKPGDVTEQPALATPVAPPKGETPLPGAPVMLAEGLTPPVPSTSGSAPSPQAQPSTVAPPSPTAGAAPGAFPVGRPTANLPEIPGSATTNAPAPQANPPGTAATTPPPPAGGLAPTR